MPLEDDRIALLLEAALDAPYSNFETGAAVLTDTGAIHQGAMVENLIFGRRLPTTRCVGRKNRAEICYPETSRRATTASAASVVARLTVASTAASVRPSCPRASTTPGSK